MLAGLADCPFNSGLAYDTGDPSRQTQPAAATTSAAGDGSGQFAARRAGTAGFVPNLNYASLTGTGAEEHPRAYWCFGRCGGSPGGVSDSVSSVASSAVLCQHTTRRQLNGSSIFSQGGLSIFLELVKNNSEHEQCTVALSCEKRGGITERVLGCINATQIWADLQIARFGDQSQWGPFKCSFHAPVGA